MSEQEITERIQYAKDEAARIKQSLKQKQGEGYTWKRA